MQHNWRIGERQSLLEWFWRSDQLDNGGGEGAEVGEDADRRLGDALDYNPTVPLMMAAGKGPLPMAGPTVTLGGPDEAAGYAEAFGDAWRATSGALEWLMRAAVAQARRAPKRRSRQGSGSRRGKTARGRRGKVR
ncbi:MAG TPA: hypothetical protein VF332_03535 [Vicinamibacterales bacterium]